MKKVLFLILSIFIFQQASFAFFEKNIDIYKISDKNAANIVYEYVLEKENWTKNFAEQELNFKSYHINAFFIDLNGDNNDEIIAANNSVGFSGTAGSTLYILTEKNNEYVNIVNFINYYPMKNMKILRTKTNNYNDIIIHTAKIAKHSNSPIIIKSCNSKIRFNGQMYILKNDILKQVLGNTSW